MAGHEKWKVGNYSSVVVSDTKVRNTNFPTPPNAEESKDEDLEHYGGYLVAESIGNSEHAKLIAAAPELLEALKFCKSVIESQGMFDLSERMAVDKADAAIKNATN